MTPKFKRKEWSYTSPLGVNASICNCCGATFEGVDHWSTDYYTKSKLAAGKGILLTATEPTRLLAENEQITTVNSRNGTFYFVTRHKE